LPVRDAGRPHAYLFDVTPLLRPRIAKPAGAGTPEDAEVLCREWYEAHGGAVYNYLRFHVAEPDIAEDLTAETFLHVVRAADHFDPDRGSAKAWILTVARNALADWRRRARLRQYVPIGNLHDLVFEAPSPEERLLREEEVSRLMDGVASLSPADRELIGLRYGSELDTAEMAAALGVAEGTVRTRMWRALGRLREELTR
jgi:RNA polymerase sigma-70 factor (ECF subfamily)